MICPNCNKEIADGSVFCTECGSKLTAEVNATPTVNATNPDVIVVGGVYSAKMRGLSKKQFLATEAPAGIRKAPKICMILFGVLAVLILTSAILFSNITFFDLPIVKLAVEESELKETKELFAKNIEEMDDMQDELDEIKEDLTKKEQKLLTKYIDSLRNVMKKFSISSFVAMEKTYEQIKDLDDIEDSDLEELAEDMEELSEIVSFLKSIRNIVLIVGIASVLLLFVSAYFMRTGFAVVAGIFYIPLCMIVINVVMALLIWAVIIALTVFTRKVNKAWKKGI
ncbi:MAG: zinc-ribbon domain-containing protein [Clostridia bacterium]|nr:zinc-ribbon domain-containing protein [Clostridia bacterium]